jgi:hypothetical protein
VGVVSILKVGHIIKSDKVGLIKGVGTSRLYVVGITKDGYYRITDKRGNFYRVKVSDLDELVSRGEDDFGARIVGFSKLIQKEYKDADEYNKVDPNRKSIDVRGLDDLDLSDIKFYKGRE